MRPGARLRSLPDLCRNILAAGQDQLPIEPRAETNPTPMHANIRGADYYAAAATSETTGC